MKNRRPGGRPAAGQGAPNPEGNASVPFLVAAVMRPGPPRPEKAKGAFCPSGQGAVPRNDFSGGKRSCYINARASKTIAQRRYSTNFAPRETVQNRLQTAMCSI